MRNISVFMFLKAPVGINLTYEMPFSSGQKRAEQWTATRAKKATFVWNSCAIKIVKSLHIHPSSLASLKGELQPLNTPVSPRFSANIKRARNSWHARGAVCSRGEYA